MAFQPICKFWGPKCNDLVKVVFKVQLGLDLVACICVVADCNKLNALHLTLPYGDPAKMEGVSRDSTWFVCSGLL